MVTTQNGLFDTFGDVVNLHKYDESPYRSDAYIIFSFLSTRHNVVDHLVESIVLVMQSLILQFEVFEFFILIIAVTLEQLCQIVDSLAYLLM